MGLTKLTRYGLFRNAFEVLERQEFSNRYMFENINEIKEMYYNSAIIIEGMEEIINDDNELLMENTFEELIDNNIRQINDDKFVDIIRSSIERQINDKREKNKKLEFKDYFRFLLRSLTEYQNKMIDNNFIRRKEPFETRRGRPQTFLSYAYSDKGITLALYYMFEVKGGFLYVNWMWEGSNNDGKITKKELESALVESDQFLFLRTPNSELHIKGNNSIRQWCSWEIGFFYLKNRAEKYYTSFYDKRPTRNDMLDTFSAMLDVVNGEVIGL